MKIRTMIPKKAGSLAVSGSGNVFVDAGFNPREASALLIKAELTRQIARRIGELGLTQTAASRRLGISQPDVSKLVAGRYTGFSSDRLIALLNALGVDVDIIVRPQRPGHGGALAARPHARRTRAVQRRTRAQR
jgi:predicted XRE-type DNA-binding protein